MTSRHIPLKKVIVLHLIRIVCLSALLLALIGFAPAGFALTEFALTEFTPAEFALTKFVQANAVDSSETKVILVHFRAESPMAERQAFIDSIPGQLMSWIEPLHIAKVMVPATYNLSDGITIGGTSTEGLVDEVEVDGIVYGTFQPDDPDLYDSQRTYAPELLNLYDAWDYTTGSADVIVAVLDTGIASAHPEFSGRLVDGHDYYNNDTDPEDDHGHGTHVAGTIAAAIDNGIGSAGVCGHCSIMPIKVLNENNAGTWSGVASGLIYAADNNADVVVMSLGSTSGTQVVKEAIEYAQDQDVLIIAAAGNANSNRDFFPAAYDGVIGVAATDRNDKRWVLSNYGDFVDISAPGHMIYSTYKDLENSYSGHVFMSGTSMATPHVGGLAGLIKSQDTSRSSAEVAAILLNSALDLGDPGRDEHFGIGRIDPLAALEYTLPEPPTLNLSGILWMDDDADGYIDGEETVRISDVFITLYNSANEIAGNARSDEQGTWQISQLVADTYSIAITTPGQNLIWTNPSQNSITLSANREQSDTDFGFVSELPATVVSDVNVQRDESEVTLAWDVVSDLVTGLNLERSIDDGEFEIVEVFDFSETSGANSAGSYVDTLPEGMEDADVIYRMQVLPGQNYINSFSGVTTPQTTELPDVVQQPPQRSGLLFLPWVVP